MKFMKFKESTNWQAWQNWHNWQNRQNRQNWQNWQNFRLVLKVPYKVTKVKTMVDLFDTDRQVFICFLSRIAKSS